MTYVGQGHRLPALEVRPARARISTTSPSRARTGRRSGSRRAEPKPDSPHFGGGTRVYNVIDTRQAYLQKVVAQGLRALKFEAQAAKSVHFSYEMVALSPKSLKELGYKATDEEKDRAFLEVSGRKGLGVKADDLLDRLEEKALAEVEKRNPDLDGGVKQAIAREIAAGALRYFMLKFARNSLIVFDFEEALSFEGETGPYLQYTLRPAQEHLPQARGADRADRSRGPRLRGPGRGRARALTASRRAPISGTSSSTRRRLEEEVLGPPPCSNSPIWPSSPSTSARRSTAIITTIPSWPRRTPTSGRSGP